MKDCSLKIEHIEKYYGKLHILKDISMEIHKGELVCLLGPSGCGKSTLLRMISGLDTMDGGSIVYGDTSWNNLTTQKRNVGMVFQNYSLFPNMTALDNVAFGLEMKAMPKTEARREALKWLDIVGLKDLANRYEYQLSGGQQQRVALARALAPQPNVLLLDEPLSALDAAVRTTLRYEIRRIQKKLGITTVFVTHDQEEALAISDRVALMKDGVLLEYATPQELFSDPKHIFTARFIGKSNEIAGEIPDPATPFMSAGDLKLALPDQYIGKFQPHEAVRAFIHADDVRIATEKESGSNIVTGEVFNEIYLGSTIRYEVHTKELSDLDVDVPAKKALSVEEKSALHLALPKDFIHVFPASDAM